MNDQKNWDVIVIGGKQKLRVGVARQPFVEVDGQVQQAANFPLIGAKDDLVGTVNIAPDIL